MNTLKISHLNKTYPGGVKALNDVSIEIQNGLFGLLGPNGAGKSTLMRTIATLQDADSGSAFLNDIDIFAAPGELRKNLGYLPQEFGVYPRITAGQLLSHLAVLKGISSASERKDLVSYLLKRVNLYPQRNKSVKGFSGGMKQRIGIAQALIGNPKLIVVDEPTAGLDPGERNRFYNLLADIGEEVIVILSTHIVDDVRQLCSNMAIMHQGSIVYQGAPQAAMDSLAGKVYHRMVERSDLKTYDQNYQVISHKMIAGQSSIHILSEADSGEGFMAVEPNLEDVFFSTLQTDYQPA